MRISDWSSDVCSSDLIDRERLAARGMIVPGTPVTGIAEEYRIVKRELIRNFGGVGNRPILPRGHRVLIASANPGEGKTFSAVNLALSLAVEADHDVLLIDAAIAQPSVLVALGLEDGPGLMGNGRASWRGSVGQ